MSGETTADDIASEPTLVYSANGEIIIVSLSASSSMYSVYNIKGQMVTNGAIKSAVTKIPVEKGFYVVRCGNEAEKVMVK